MYDRITDQNLHDVLLDAKGTIESQRRQIERLSMIEDAYNTVRAVAMAGRRGSNELGGIYRSGTYGLEMALDALGQRIKENAVPVPEPVPVPTDGPDMPRDIYKEAVEDILPTPHAELEMVSKLRGVSAGEAFTEALTGYSPGPRQARISPAKESDLSVDRALNQE